VARRILSPCLVAAAVVATTACAAPVRVKINRPTPTVAATAPSAPTTTDGAEVSATQAPTPMPSPTSAGTEGTLVTAGGAFVLRTPPPLELEIPSIDLATPVEDVPSVIDDEGWSWALPEWTAAHHLGTANPGEPGNIVISGHVSVRGDAGVFNQLQGVSIGDAISVTSANGEFRYIVESLTVVPESDLSIFLQVPYEQLTLITCVPDGEFKHRLVVRAKPA
jgi:sortase A